MIRSRVFLVRVIVSTALALAILAPGLPTYAASPQPAAASSGAVDITVTTTGHAAALLAAQRLTSVGHPTDAASLMVIREADGSVTTMPKGMTRSTATRPDGTIGPSVVLQAPSPSLASAGVSPAAGAQYWNQINNGCLSETKSQGWMYNCWSLKKMFNGYSNYDFFIVSFNGTAYSNGSGMHYAYVELTKNSSSAAFTVVDWSPKSNYSNNCSTQTIGVSYILSWSMNVTMCENWGVYADPINHPGTQYSEWYCVCTIYNDAREATVVQEVETVKNARPIWNLLYDFA